MWSYNVHLVHEKLSNLFGGSDGLWPIMLSRIVFGVAAVYQLVCSVLFMLGYEPMLMAQLLLVWIVPITFTVHDMWTIEHDHPAHVNVEALTSMAKGQKKGKKKKVGVIHGDASFPDFASRHIAIFPTEFDNEFVHFFKNVGMIGGLVLYLVLQQ